MIQILAQGIPALVPSPAPTPNSVIIPKFTPNTAIWAPLLGPITNVSAGLVLSVLGVIGLASLLVFVFARKAHNHAWAMGGAMGMGLVLVAAVGYGAIASGGLQQFGVKAGDILGNIAGKVIP